VPGRCSIGELELELYPATGHTKDGMAIWAPWTGVLIVGDYLSAVEIPCFAEGGGAPAAYIATLERLQELVALAEHIVPGHGPVLGQAQALVVLEEDLAYLRALEEQGLQAELPTTRRTRAQQRLHAQNAAQLDRLHAQP
jgi:glyoxylase-like metal-dependent hydrolase (beta-lactamase superfamily II)